MTGGSVQQVARAACRLPVHLPVGAVVITDDSQGLLVRGDSGVDPSPLTGYRATASDPVARSRS